MDKMQQTSPSDTQWSRWEVFKQDTPKKPHQAVGSVHATDAAQALLNARTVFARRPKTVSLWVAPADEIFAVTKQEIDDQESKIENRKSGVGEESPETYLVFGKTSHRSSLAFVNFFGELPAITPQQALQRAMLEFIDKPVLSWWVVPARAVARSQEEDIKSWFEPAEAKTYKQQSEYGVVGSHPGKNKGGRRHERGG